MSITADQFNHSAMSFEPLIEEFKVDALAYKAHNKEYLRCSMGAIKIIFSPKVMEMINTISSSILDAE